MEEYAELLNNYMQKFSIVYMLQNKFIQFNFNDFGEGNVIRIINKDNNKLFELRPKSRNKHNEVIITIWGIIQMYFHEYLTYSGFKAWLNLIDNVKLVQINVPK